MKENKLLMIEMLFRFTDKNIKDAILCNYAEPYNDVGDQVIEN